MTVYTGSGDKGKTSLFSGERVTKADERIEAYGNVDELNALIGMLSASISGDHPSLADQLGRIQAELFHIGAWLATTPDSSSTSHLENLSGEAGHLLESAMDRMEAELPPLKNFIHPGGHSTAAWAHMGRTVCRRVERHVVRLTDPDKTESTEENLSTTLVFLNRLSDYLFVLARYLNHEAGIPETAWPGE